MTHEPCSASNIVMREVSWTAIIVGALVGIGLSFLLNVFSISIGLSIVHTTPTGVLSLAIGGYLGVLIGTVASMFVAGMTAGYLGRAYCHKSNIGVLYGFVTWCLALLLTAILAGHLENYVARYSTFVSTPATLVSATLSDSAPSSIDKDKKSVNDLGMGLFFILLLFYVGAFSSCLGGYYGMTCGEKCCPTTTDRHTLP